MSESSSSIKSNDKTPRCLAVNNIKIGKIKTKREPRSTVSKVPHFITEEKKKRNIKKIQDEITGEL